MIEKVTAYKSSDGKTFEKIEDVQKHEIKLLLITDGLSEEIQNDAMAESLVSNRDKIIDILSTGPRSKPKARSINGGRKTRTPKPVSDGKAAA